LHQVGLTNHFVAPLVLLVGTLRNGAAYSSENLKLTYKTTEHSGRQYS